jgi:hypothetical protein
MSDRDFFTGCAFGLVLAGCAAVAGAWLAADECGEKGRIQVASGQYQCDRMPDENFYCYPVTVEVISK